MGLVIPDVYIDIDPYVIRTVITKLHMPRESVIIALKNAPIPDHEWEIDYEVVDITYTNIDNRTVKQFDFQTKFEDLGIDMDKFNEKVCDQVIAMYTYGDY